jgi:hypothetical protein
MFLGWFSKATICLASRFSGIGSATICRPGRHLRTHSLPPGFARFCSTLTAIEWKHAGPGPWASVLSGKYLGVRKSCAAQFITWPVILSLSLLALHVPFCTWPGTLDSCLYELGNGVPLRSTFFGLSSRMGWGRNIRAVKPIMKPVPKRLRTLLLLRNQPLSPAGTSPARSKLNDLVRLRAAIITSCIFGATKESR